MKKKLLSVALCAALVFAMAVPAFADGFSGNPPTDIVNFSFADGIQPSSVNSFTYQFQLKGTNLYLNVNNSANPGTAANGNAVIVWNAVNTKDQQWYLVARTDGSGYFLYTALHLDYGMNINHVQNVCNLIQHPQVNNYQGKNDSALFAPAKTSTSTIVLADWPYALTNSIAQAGYTSYWTSSGSQYAAS